VFDAALEALRFELAHAEASRSRAAGMLTATGVLLALTVSLSSTASTAVSHLTYIGKTVVIVAAALASVCLLAAGVLSGLVFAPARRTRTPVEEMRSCPSFASANQTRKSWSPARSGTCPCPDRPTSVPARGS
jgi:hypothetical protein